jgi:hypothetical protein
MDEGTEAAFDRMNSQCNSEVVFFLSLKSRSHTLQMTVELRMRLETTGRDFVP